MYYIPTYQKIKHYFLNSAKNFLREAKDPAESQPDRMHIVDNRSFYRYALRQVTRLVNVQTFGYAQVIAQKLKGDNSQAGGEVLVSLWNIYGKAGGIFNGIISVGGEAHYIGSAAFAFHQVA